MENSKQISNGVNFPEFEEKVLEKWNQEKTFEKSLAKRTLRDPHGKTPPRFVFYEGPPAANGRPGIHHVESRSFKDVVLRYKTMAGFYVPRRAGWDTHGLPVEIAVEKQLGLKSKKEIEIFGIERFNEECKKSVWQFQKEWEDVTRRMGFWLDTKNFYATYQTNYIESLWFIIKTWWNKKLLYKGYKVVPLCTRCGTPLSSHELAQGYKTVKDRSVYVKFLIKDESLKRLQTTNHRSQTTNYQLQSVYFLAWTTTPWTLPGNVALAVGKDIEYALVQKENEHYILAKDLVEKVLGQVKIIKTFFGKDFVGLKYEPLFSFGKPEAGKKIYEVVPADFVSVQDGTGIVHTAVAYGAEDFELGKKEGLAVLHLLGENGIFGKDTGFLSGVYATDANALIIKDLAERNLLLKEEEIEHEYPHCWRCQTPLLYFAKDSWFVNMQKVKKQLNANNKKINWIPSHLKEGRMGEWLKEVKDWAFSRERYWGTPLPVWVCKECNHVETIGSIEELKNRQRPKNSYILMRHGHSERQKTDIMSCWPEKKPFPLTPQGKKEVLKTAKELKKKKPDMIFSSDLLRTKETAEIVGQELGLKVTYEKRLREINVGTLNGMSTLAISREWAKPGETEMEHYMRRFTDPMPGGENWVDIQKKMYELVKELENAHEGKTIILISHEGPLTLLEGSMKGMSREDIVVYRKKKGLTTGEARQVPFAFLPYNLDMEIDLHRPFVDEIFFPCAKCQKGTMQRVKDVVDVWFDSGAMPFAQDHWPFELKTKNYKLQTPLDFPADYITEGVDQTRGWFYTLLAVSTLLGFGVPYKNVISLGHVLDEKGEKMSKSKGNVVSPWDMIQKYGVDTIRWYFFSLSHPWDPKLFAEKDLQQVSRKFIAPLWNSFVFYDTYCSANPAGVKPSLAKLGLTENMLDKWVLSRLNSVAQEMTKTMDAYDITGAARTLEDFVVNDLSLWYIRRSRSRLQNPQTKKEFKEASSTLGYVLRQTCILGAPFIPFLTEYIYNLLGKGKEKAGSVHFESWPKAGKKNEKLEQEMELVRDLASKGLALRAIAGVKVRQPLQRLKINPSILFGAGVQRIKVSEELLNLLKDELNVKEIVVDATIATEVELDTALTPALLEEGTVREIVRNIQGMRKDAGYKPQDKALLQYQAPASFMELFRRNIKTIQSIGGLSQVLEGDSPKKVFDVEKNIIFPEGELWLGITKT